ncbi:hypothetical protein MMC11_007906 [Xylographa trunciseda]|nr:hypothetical protein [Xylographa trunciseda]
MATSSHAPHLPPPAPSSTPAHLTSPRSTRTLRKLQSAHALSSNYTAAGNAPSLISQQRQLQHHKSAILRDSGPPPVPLLAAPPQGQLRSRMRADSDSAAVAEMSIGAGAARRTAIAKKINGEDKNSKEELEMLVRQGPKGDLTGSLASLRRSVLLDGLVADSDGMVHCSSFPTLLPASFTDRLFQSQLRIYIWLILLNAPPLRTDAYLSLIHRGASPAYAKIRNDTFRTLATDPLFKRRVSEASLIRLLNALAWTLHDAQSQPPQKHALNTSPTTDRTPPKPTPDPASIYLQGMNVLSAPFLYAARSEAEAYILTHHLLSAHLPAYIHATMPGVHRGLALVDRLLAIIDPKLAAHLAAAALSASIYAFPSVLTLCACTPPLPEVLYLWDFLFAYGVHLNILAIVAQLVLMREEILAADRPGTVLRGFPPLRAKRVVQLAVSFVGMVPAAVYEELVAHVR